jgi:uncharacterized protein
MTGSFLEQLKSFEDTQIAKTVARDPVNMPMIRQWCDALGDTNPVYTSAQASTASLHAGLIAPPTMLQAWCMPGIRQEASMAPEVESHTAVLEQAGFTGVVATNCDQEYRRQLRHGDVLTETKVVEEISAEKQTAIGRGHFVTTMNTYSDQDGKVVAIMRFRLLRYKPNTGRPPHSEANVTPPEAKRPRPSLTLDNAWWFEALRHHHLLIQRCTACARMRHPVQPGCSRCGSLEWDTVEASGRGRIYSFVVNHYPVIPGFPSPLLVGLIELEEGTRLVANVIGIEPREATIGMPVNAEFVDHDDELSLVAFRPVGTPS